MATGISFADSVDVRVVLFVFKRGQISTHVSRITLAGRHCREKISFVKKNEDLKKDDTTLSFCSGYDIS